MSKNAGRALADNRSAVAGASSTGLAAAGTSSVSLAAAGTAARDAKADVPSAAKRTDADASSAAERGSGEPSALKRPHFLDVMGKTAHGGQLGATDLYKSYRKGAVEVPVLRGVCLDVQRGELLAIVGQSGSGKSTLLHLLGTLDAPDRGAIYYDGRRIDNLPTRARDHLRNRRFGMIFQFYHLLPELTTLENVLAPLMISDGLVSYLRHRRQYRARAKELLDMLGLGHRLKHRPRELSGGEMQRAAIARALVAKPDLLLADEPTGNLDAATGRDIVRILRDLNVTNKLTIVMVTHDQAIAEHADRVVRLTNGTIEGLEIGD